MIAHEDAEILTGDHMLAEVMAPESALKITKGHAKFCGRSGADVEALT